MRKILFAISAFLLAFTMVGCTPTEKTINVYTRDGKSGTRDGFMTNIGLSEAKEDNGPLVDTLSEVTSNGDMITKIKNDEYGIGYISLSTLKDSGVKGLNYQGVEPTEANVLNKTYKLTRNFNYIIRAEYENETKGKIIEALVAYMSTVEGKTTMKSADGILEISEQDKSWDDIKSQYPVCDLDNSGITLTFGGSTSVSKMSQKLTDEFSALCGNFVAVHDHTGSGDAYKRTQGSDKDGANACDMAFASREFSATEIAASNTTGKMCTDAIVTIVNTVNSITAITKEMLVQIYTGEITKWSEVK